MLLKIKQEYIKNPVLFNLDGGGSKNKKQASKDISNKKQLHNYLRANIRKLITRNLKKILK